MKRVLALAMLCAIVLGACSHARVVQREGSARQSSAARAPSRPSLAPLPADGVHVVRRGETLYGISFRYGLRYQDVAAWNAIPDPYLIEVGQRLRLSPARRGTSAPVATATPPPRPVSRPPAAPPVSSRPVATPPVAAQPPVVLAPPPTFSASPPWRWPAQGQIIGKYVTGDQTRQGIDIAGAAGQDVLAAADGVVVYSGAGLVGYGELIIIKHSEEWLSAYAHNQKRLVAEGTRVTAGQVIAHMGHTGAPRDMLHFEIRRNGKPVDPLGQLPRR